MNICELLDNNNVTNNVVINETETTSTDQVNNIEIDNNNLKNVSSLTIKQSESAAAASENENNDDANEIKSQHEQNDITDLPETSNEINNYDLDHKSNNDNNYYLNNIAETNQSDENSNNLSNLTTTIFNSTSHLNDESNDDDIVDYNKMMLYFSVNNQSSNDFGSRNECDNSMDCNNSDPNNDRNNNDSMGYGSSNDDDIVFEALGPYEKLCKLCDNPSPSNIESASKYVVPALEFCSTQEDVQRVFSYLRKYCFYSDVLLRSLWLEQIQNVIQYLHQEADNLPVQFKSDFSMSNELALLIKDLTREQSYQVKKCATSSLIYLVERQLLDNDQIENIIIPCLLSLINENNEDFHIDCVSLFGKLAPLIGHELTSKYFIQPFCRLCSSPVFHTRKACASNIADLANVISTEEVENYLLPHFCEFMKDQVWAIRKVCADLFSSFALKCTRKKRQEVLTEYFIKLLDDNSRWVKISAYKSLGSFIATFYKSSEDEEEEEKNNDTTMSSSNVSLTETSNKTQQETSENSTSSNNTNSNNNNNEKNNSVEESGNGSESNNVSESIENTNKNDINYSNFMYWRNTLPSLDLKSSNPTANNSSTNQQDSNFDEVPKSKSNQDEDDNNDAQSISILSTNPTSTLTELVAAQQQQQSNLKNSFDSIFNQKSNTTINQSNLYSSSNFLSIYTQQNQQQNQFGNKTLEELSDELKQDIVPPVLLSYYITMVDVNTQNSLDSEMNYNCAYNFPAIALTLGAKNWKYIKNLYKKLAEDVSWKVRQTLAYSIHELAIILGQEYTQTDLVPIFDSYIKDVDEVRIGIVANLTKFLKVLNVDYRRSYMPKLNDFLKMDNQRNWRFRNELGLQIIEFCELFPTDCLAEYVQPVAFILALDKVAEVRTTAVKAMVELLKQFELHNNEQYRRNFVDDVTRTFANSNKWSLRQLYVILCESILISKAYSDIEVFSKEFLPKLFSFRNEKVPNIRVLLARVIKNQLLNLGQNPFSHELEITIQYLTNDTDKDVKSFFCSSSENTCDTSDRTSLPSYSDLIENKENQQQSDQINNPNLNIELANSNFLYNYNELTKMDTSNNSTITSINAETSSNETSSNKKLIFGDDGGRVLQDDEDEDDDDEDEVIDKTRINQLKIVNLENDLDDEMEHEDNLAATTATENLLTNSNEINLDNKNKIIPHENSEDGADDSSTNNKSINSNNKSSDSSAV